jgi:putative flippase GtrA
MVLIIKYRGIVSMVAHRSPKPPVRVRVLLPLPFNFKSILILYLGEIKLEKLKELLKKVLTKEVIFYIIFGVFTTCVNLLVFYLLTLIHLNENVANIIAILTAVLFAYFTNRKLVFNSKANTFKEKLYEFYKFMLGRAFTMVVEALGFPLLYNVIGIQELISKLIISFVVIVLNFFISKFFAFKKKD